MPPRETVLQRKAAFKTPPTLLDGGPQHARRVAALAAQQYARTVRQNAHRTNIDEFAALSLGNDDGDGDDGDAEIDRSEGVAKYVSSVQPSDEKAPKKKKESRWANCCMYAELLELHRDDAMDGTGDVTDDGIPKDLQEGWIALAPMPMGKRCLAVTTNANGIAGVMSKTSLKSRLKGHTLLNFPSTLPPDTILDCILDANWQTTGILHILDVVRWRGRDFDDCSADMRFWWRDVRLAEIGQANPGWSFTPAHGFQFPVKFLPVPYFDQPSYHTFLTTLIPQCQAQRIVQIELPAAPGEGTADDSMDVDQASTKTVDVPLNPDGMLLYVRESFYESGTSPLCVWVPSQPPDPTAPGPNPLDVFEMLIRQRLARA
ncbi:hypothetical protein AURDEDRAFT_80476 [Auricularia subglabra TFB-10046 SS5]|nr:hypothetical protein AURDEDRAFT_80476 [Auricularia subglabra TFB-10046 SS5]